MIGSAFSDQEDDDGDASFAAINVTPMVDVMLVLLVIFMVGAPLMVKGVPIELPRTTATKLASPKKPMVVSLSRDGTVHLRDETVTLDNLPTRLAALRAAEGDTVVYVRADRHVPYGEVVDMLGRFGASGYARVSLLADSPSGTGPDK